MYSSSMFVSGCQSGFSRLQTVPRIRGRRYQFRQVPGFDTFLTLDSVASQASFADTNNLAYPVLSDPKDETRKAYKVSKDFFGMAPGRETFFIDVKGIVRGVCESALSGA